MPSQSSAYKIQQNYDMGLHVEKYHVVLWSTQSTTQKQTILLKVFVLFLGDKPFLEWSALCGPQDNIK